MVNGKEHPYKLSANLRVASILLQWSKVVTKSSIFAVSRALAFFANLGLPDSSMGSNSSLIINRKCVIFFVIVH